MCDTHHYSRSGSYLLRSQSQPSTGYRHSDSVSLSEKYGERRSGYEEQSDRLESFSLESVHCRGGEQKRIGEGLKKFTSAHLHLFASNSRYETEDQSEYRTDEEEANGLPQTDLDERETEIGCKPIWTFQSGGNVFKSGESDQSETEVGESDTYDEEEVVDFKARRRGAFSDEQVI